MKIDVWSDIVCPFCYIGKRKLEEALAQFPHKDQVEIEFKSYELNPNAALNSEMSMHEELAAKYGMSMEQAREMTKGVANQATAVGLTFNFDDMKSINTFDAHRLIKWAKIHGKELEMTEKLFYAHFTGSKDVSRTEILVDLAEAVGLDKDEASRILNDKALHSDEVRADEALAKQYGVQGVPYFVINNKYAISGAQPTETFAGALQKVWEEENPAPKFQDLSAESGDTSFCTDEGCVIPPNKES